MALTLLADRQYTAPSAADAVAITPSGTAWTNSAYVTVLAATPAACILTGVVARSVDIDSISVNYDVEIDIATGAAGAEVVIATVRGYDIGIAGEGGLTGTSHAFLLPVPCDNIGSGVRLAARLRKNNTGLTPWTVAVTYLQKPLAATTTLLTTAGPQLTIPPATVGVTVTAGGSAWTSGSWIQLRAAAGAALVITGVVWGAPSIGNVDYELDLGTGAGGSETVITTLHVYSTNRGQPCWLALPTPLDTVAASTRLAARLRCATASATLVVSLLVLEKPL